MKSKILYNIKFWHTLTQLKKTLQKHWVILLRWAWSPYQIQQLLVPLTDLLHGCCQALHMIPDFLLGEFLDCHLWHVIGYVTHPLLLDTPSHHLGLFLGQFPDDHFLIWDLFYLHFSLQLKFVVTIKTIKYYASDSNSQLCFSTYIAFLRYLMNLKRWVEKSRFKLYMMHFSIN